MELYLIVLCVFLLASVHTSASDDGVTSGPTSEPSACPEIPTVENAEVSPSSLKSKYNKGDLLMYNCQQGYVGRVHFICDGHKWQNTRNSKCARKRCELPQDIPNGRFAIVNGTEFVYETTIQYTCKPGYQMASLVDTRTCLADGWNNHLPECEEISCPQPVIKGNIVVDGLPESDSPLRYGHQLQFSCNTVGIKLKGQRLLVCGENGKWSDAFPSCEEIICELEEIHARVSVSGLPQNNAPAKYGQKLVFYCLGSGMVLRGNQEVTCTNDGQWSSPFPICEEITCKKEELNNVKIVYGNPRVFPPYRPKHSLAFQCTHPYWIMTGQSSVTCKEDGTWSSPFPMCSEIKGCVSPPPVQFADLTALRKPYYNSGESVQYTCQQLYTMYGHPFMTCVKGTWNGQMICLKPCIVTIEAMDARNIQQLYGPKQTMYAKHQDHISFRCQNRKQTPYGYRQQCNNGVMYLPICQQSG